VPPHLAVLSTPDELRISPYFDTSPHLGRSAVQQNWLDLLMQNLDDLLREAELAHGHLCAGQVLGVRMAMLGCRFLGINDPRGKESPDRKRLVTFVEIDRCATDAIAVVTGCRLGKRALKFRDWGKMAATFVDLGRPARPDLNLPDPIPAGRAVRIAARESSKDRARELYPPLPGQAENKNAAQMLAYREMPDEDLFTTQWVTVPLHPREMPGYKAGRILCAECGEGINFDRHLELNGHILCQSCAHPETRYYQPL
jgi:formylmethanofuran dehydrogenase subunit E